MLGRANDADIQIAGDCISRKHARLSLVPEERGPVLSLTDLGSANGTFVNDQRIEGERRLAVGDWIAMGNARLRILGVK